VFVGVVLPSADLTITGIMTNSFGVSSIAIQLIISSVSSRSAWDLCSYVQWSAPNGQFIVSSLFPQNGELSYGSYIIGTVSLDIQHRFGSVSGSSSTEFACFITLVDSSAADFYRLSRNEWCSKNTVVCVFLEWPFFPSPWLSTLSPLATQIFCLFVSLSLSPRGEKSSISRSNDKNLFGVYCVF